MLSMSVAIGSKRVLCSAQFHVKYSDTFTLEFKDNGEPFNIKFIQKIDTPEYSLLPFRSTKPQPVAYIKVDDDAGSEELCYALHNFNQTKVATNPIPFYAKQPNGRYYFQISAISISSEVDDPATIWLYTVTIYEDK